MKVKGFTLIEIMIVVAIVAILAAVAFPSYQEYVKKSRRADCKAALADAVAKQERWYFRYNQYTGDVNDIGGVSGTLESPEQFCQIAIDTSCDVGGAPISCFTLKAIPQGVQQGDKCGTLTVTNVGVKGLESATLPLDQCW